jgi:hypothetical protein
VLVLVLGTTLHGLDQDLWGELVNVCSRNLKVKPPPDLRFYSIRWSSFIQIVGRIAGSQTIKLSASNHKTELHGRSHCPGVTFKPATEDTCIGARY